MKPNAGVSFLLLKSFKTKSILIITFGVGTYLPRKDNKKSIL